MKTLIVIAGQLGVYVVLGLIWTQVGRLGQRAGKRGYTLTWIQVLALVVFVCAFVGALVLLTTHTTDYVGGILVLAVGAGAGLGAWALWRRVPAPDAPGTTESFSVSIAAATSADPWPTMGRTREKLQMRPGDRELVAAPVLLVGGLQPIHANLLLTDQQLVLTIQGKERLQIPRSRVQSVTYRIRRDQLTIGYRAERGEETVDLTTLQLVWHGGPRSRTYQLFEALRTGFLNPKSIGEPLRIEPPPSARSWIVAGLLFLAVAGGGMAFMIGHYLDLRSAAQVYDQAPICASVGPALCRPQESAVVLGDGAGRHPDGTSGGKAWVMFKTDDGMVRFADLPNGLTVTPATHERIIVESWKGRISQIVVQGEIQVTYDNPDWTASNYAILVGMAAAGAAIVLGLFAWAGWRDLRREPAHPLAQAA